MLFNVRCIAQNCGHGDNLNWSRLLVCSTRGGDCKRSWLWPLLALSSYWSNTSPLSIWLNLVESKQKEQELEVAERQEG